MPRNVTFTATGNIKFDPNLEPGQTPPAPNIRPWPRDDSGKLKTLSICGCGISRTFPICDGAHKCCKDEEPNHVYTYDPVTLAVVEKKPNFTQ